jgi:hypothetical protein
MALWPWKKRHSAPIFHDFLMIFPVFFGELFRRSANGREKGAESAGSVMPEPGE